MIERGIVNRQQQEILVKIQSRCSFSGKQYMGRRFRRVLERAGVRMTVGERGYKDNILIERLFRSYKWECVYSGEKMGLKEPNQFNSYALALQKLNELIEKRVNEI